MTESENPLVEAAITTCVRHFYGNAREDPLLGPIFDAEIHDWEAHLRIVDDFWSSVLLKTERYSGHPYVVHVPLPIEPEHVERWLELFADSAQAALTPPYTDIAIARARLMGDGIKVGLFPFVDKEGKPARHPG